MIIFYYLDFRIQGFSHKQSLAWAWEKNSLADIQIFICIIGLIILFVILNQASDIKRVQFNYSAQIANLKKTLYYKNNRIDTLEKVLVSCLNNRGITVNKYSMNCQVKEYTSNDYK